MRYIPVKSCLECPHRAHEGGFDKVSFIPMCNNTMKQLPYTVGKSLIISPTYEIPDWCPLETL